MDMLSSIKPNLYNKNHPIAYGAKMRWEQEHEHEQQTASSTRIMHVLEEMSPAIATVRCISNVANDQATQVNSFMSILESDDVEVRPVCRPRTDPNDQMKILL